MLIIILTTDIVEGVYRGKVRPSEKCSVMNRFIFNWKSLAESEQNKVLPVEKAILRAYLKVIPRHLRGNTSKVTVQVSSYMNLLERNTSIIEAGEHNLSVTTNSSGWIELNVTKGVRSLWPPVTEESEIEITVVLRTDCAVTRKVPACFEDPTSIEPSKKKRRRRKLALQPLLLVYLSDETIKEIVRNESKNVSDDGETIKEIVRNEKNVSDDGETIITTGSDRRKRSDTSMCQVEDFHVSFSDLHLYHIIVPSGYNAKQCKGSCSYAAITTNDFLANNHAKIMASAELLSNIRPSVTFINQPKGPCCVPVKYSSMTLILPKGDSFEYVIYPHMIVDACRCR